MQRWQGRTSKLIASHALLAFAAGCGTPVTLAASTHPIPYDQTMTRLGPVEASAWNGIFLFIPFGAASPLKSARDEALRDTHADALIGVTVEHRVWFLLLLILRETKLEAEAVKFTD